jgi:peptidoglycan/LPS O-acetylase OafA/YrhL
MMPQPGQRLCLSFCAGLLGSNGECLLLRMAFLRNLFTSDEITLPNAFYNTYIPALDGLRGIAIIAVILSHIAINTPLVEFGLGDIGVDIFFVLSGFLITSLLLKEKIKTANVSLKNFYIRRALRILPVAYLFLLVLLGLDCLFKLNLSAASYLAAAFYVRNFNLQYVTNWYNGHFWTLSIEEQFYIIFPFFIVYSFKNYIRLIFIIILFLPLLSYAAFHNIGIFYSNFFVHKVTYLLINIVQQGTISILIGSLFSILMFKKLLPADALVTKRYHGLVVFLPALTVRLIFNYFMVMDYVTIYLLTLKK